MILGFTKIPTATDLIVAKETDEMVLFEPFILHNPPSDDKFPPSDEPYYTSLEMSLRHLLFKFSKGWITSERQVIYSSEECISTVHFIFDNYKRVIGINVFQRSSNILNLEDDCQFFNYFISKYLNGKLGIDVNIMVSMPHLFKGKKKKIED